MTANALTGFRRLMTLSFFRRRRTCRKIANVGWWLDASELVRVAMPGKQLAPEADPGQEGAVRGHTRGDCGTQALVQSSVPERVPLCSSRRQLQDAGATAIQQKYVLRGLGIMMEILTTIFLYFHQNTQKKRS